MDTTQTLLDALKNKLQLRSDYALAKYLGVTGVTMLRWREGKGMSDANAVRVAKLLEMEPAYVLACMGAQSCEPGSEESGVWRQIAGAFHHTVALWLLAGACLFTGILSSAPGLALTLGFDNCILCKVSRRVPGRPSQKTRPN